MPLSKPANYLYEFGPFRLDTRARLLLRDGVTAPLRTKALEVLLLLVRYSGQIIEKDVLMQQVWPGTMVTENNLAQSISALKKALGQDPAGHKYIETISGRGYRFVAGVRSLLDEGTESGIRSAGYPRSAEIGVAVGSLAVLPFTLVGAESQDEYLELGMADAIITRLSNATQLIVRPTTSVRRYDGQAQDPVAAGRELKVESVLVGTIQRVSQTIRLTVQLVRAGDGAALWAAKFDAQSNNILEAQDLISEQVARALLLRLSGEEKRLLAKRQTESAEAHQAYLKGRYFWNKRNEEGLKKGIEYFQQAIDADPNYALAHTGLADSYAHQGVFHYLSPREAFPKATEAILKALEIDDTLAEAHTSLAHIKLYYDFDWAGASRELKRAIELNPNYATAHHWYGWYLLATGSFDRALAEIKRALEVDPLSLIINAVLGVCWLRAREYDLAIAQFRKSLEIDPNFAFAHCCLGVAEAQQARFEDAIAALKRAVDLSGGGQLMTGALGYVYAACGQTLEARRLLDDLKELSRQRYVSPFTLAVIYAGLGAKEQALACFEKAYRERSRSLFWANINPMLDSLRPEPRFQSLLRRVGFPE
ncbi:MAG: winged helix-turn-helix domain-containing tetratricopeptide repeat protein [Blastocatellia bacterium]